MSLEVTDLAPVGHGIERPEHVVVTSDGRLFASDKASAVAEILGENRIRRIGKAGGEPNGIAVDQQGHFLIANFGSGVLQDLDPNSGDITPLLSGEVDGQPLKWLNYVLADSSGALWCSVSTATDDLLDTLSLGTSDGYIFHVAPDRSTAAVVARVSSFRIVRPLTTMRSISMSFVLSPPMRCGSPSSAPRWVNKNSSARAGRAAGRRIRCGHSDAPRWRRDGSSMGDGRWLRAGLARKPLGHTCSREQDRGNHARGTCHGRGRGPEGTVLNSPTSVA